MNYATAMIAVRAVLTALQMLLVWIGLEADLMFAAGFCAALAYQEFLELTAAAVDALMDWRRDRAAGVFKPLEFENEPNISNFWPMEGEHVVSPGVEKVGVQVRGRRMFRNAVAGLFCRLLRVLR